MKIAFIRKNFTPYGGAELYLAQVINELSKKGHEIHIFAHNWVWQKKERKNIFFHKINIFKQLSFIENFSFAINSYKAIRQEKFDIIHSFDRTLFQDVYGAFDGCHYEWLRQRKKIDPWYKKYTNSINPHHLAILFLEGQIFNSSFLKCIIALSKRGKEEIINHYKVSEPKIRVIYCGVDLEKFHPRNVGLYRQKWREKFGINFREILFLFVGSGFRRKGLSFLLQALSRLRNKRVKLLVIGKDNTTKFLKMAKTLNVANQVIFAGPQLEMEKIYAAADFLILPSIYEPFGIVCMEALASGLPIIITKITGAAEIVREGENGIIIEDPIKIPEFVCKLEEAINIWNHGYSRENVRERSSLFSMESNVNDLLAIYEEILASRSIKDF